MFQQLNCQEGVLLLADMGSLCNLGTMLMERLQVQVRTLDMVSTPLILEAMRKVDLGGMDLDTLYESLLGFKGYEAVEFTEAPPLDGTEAIVTVCSTGQGAALKLKEFVEGILQHIVDRAVHIIPIGMAEMEQRLAEIAEQYKLVAVVGMAQPKYPVPFIPLDKLIDGDGEAELAALLKSRVKIVAREPDNIVVRKLCEESLQKFLTYMNPGKVISVLLEFDSVLEQKLARSFSNPVRIRLIVHCGCALERIVIRSPLIYQGDKEKIDTQKLRSLKSAASVFERALNITLDDDELCYMADMI